MRWLGEHMVPFSAWIRFRVIRQERVILHECVLAHTSDYLLRRYLASSHLIFCFPFCPSMLGHPTTRKRKFTVAIHRAFIVERLCATPTTLFKFKMVASGQIYFAAAEYELHAFLASCQADSFRDVVPHGALQRPFKKSLESQTWLEGLFLFTSK